MNSLAQHWEDGLREGRVRGGVQRVLYSSYPGYSGQPRVSFERCYAASKLRTG